MLGMNSVMMREYVEYVADYLLDMLGLEPLFGGNNPVRFVAGAERMRAKHDFSFRSWSMSR